MSNTLYVSFSPTNPNDYENSYRQQKLCELLTSSPEFFFHCLFFSELQVEYSGSF